MTEHPEDEEIDVSMTIETLMYAAALPLATAIGDRLQLLGLRLDTDTHSRPGLVVVRAYQVAEISIRSTSRRRHRHESYTMTTGDRTRASTDRTRDVSVELDETFDKMMFAAPSNIVWTQGNWIAVVDRSTLEHTGVELRLGCPDDADQALTLLATALERDRWSLEIKPRPGWCGFLGPPGLPS